MSKLSLAERRSRAAERVEIAAADLFFRTDRWTLTGRTLFDIRNDRRDLLTAARYYGNAVRLLGRVR